MEQTERARVLFAYDCEMVRHGIVRSLSDCPDFDVAAEVGTVGQARQALEVPNVDCVILSIEFPDGCGLAYARELKDQHPDLNVVVLSRRNDEETLLAAVRACADGYVLKSSPFERFLEVTRSVVRGQAMFDPSIAVPALRRLADGGGEPGPQGSGHGNIDLVGLSVRERQVVDLLSKGMTNKEISNELSISISTTKTHISRVFKHLGITSRRELLPRFLIVGGMNGR